MGAKDKEREENVCRNGVSRVNFSKYTQNGPSILASASLVKKRDGFYGNLPKMMPVSYKRPSVLSNKNMLNTTGRCFKC